MPNRLALTIGDPTGIGPEITVKALQRLGEFPPATFRIFGSKASLVKAAASLGLSLSERQGVSYHDILAPSPGAIAYKAVEAGVRSIRDGQTDALVTGPISKRNLEAAGYDYAGHTEILEALAQDFWHRPQAQAEMLFAYQNFRLLLLTRHIPLSEVPRALDAAHVKKSLQVLIDFMRSQLNIRQPHFVVLGVNPHAGEIGGQEEQEIFKPVIEELTASGMAQFTGPVAADGFFRGFDAKQPKCDAIIAAYHDQGLIPFKLVSGYEAVNVTIGLPFLRTSVSHGTAEDIAGKGIAREDSLIAAIHMALKSR